MLFLSFFLKVSFNSSTKGKRCWRVTNGKEGCGLEWWKKRDLSIFYLKKRREKEKPLVFSEEHRRLTAYLYKQFCG